MKILCVLFLGLAVTTCLAEKTNFIVDVRFSTNDANTVSVSIGPQGTGEKEFDEIILMEEIPDIATGTYVLVSNFVEHKDNTFKLDLIAKEVQITSWKTVSIKKKKIRFPTFKKKKTRFPTLAVKEVRFTELTFIEDVWVHLSPYAVRVRTNNIRNGIEE